MRRATSFSQAWCRRRRKNLSRVTNVRTQTSYTGREVCSTIVERVVTTWWNIVTHGIKNIIAEEVWVCPMWVCLDRVTYGS